MDPIQKQTLRAANIIRRRLAARQETPVSLELPEHSWTEMQRLSQQIAKAQERRWHRAARSLTDDLRYEVNSCHSRLSGLLAVLRQQSESPELPPIKEIYQEILALQEEYDAIDVDPKTGEICVTTEPIVLQDIRLGRFEIRLNWKSPSGESPYEVVALDPNPAASDSNVTHPHVQSKHLCEGDGRAAVRAALDQGRIADFFQIVIQILSTYAEGSAYVELDEWDGQPCYECGGSVPEDERYSCARCENLLCGDCSTSCEQCGEGYCSGCISACQTCEGNYCAACLENCPVCHRATCPNCLQDGLCEKCYEQQQEPDDNNGSSAEPDGQAAACPDAETRFSVPQGNGASATSSKSLAAV